MDVVFPRKLQSQLFVELQSKAKWDNTIGSIGIGERERERGDKLQFANVFCLISLAIPFIEFPFNIFRTIDVNDPTRHGRRRVEAIASIRTCQLTLISVNRQHCVQIDCYQSLARTH